MRRQRLFFATREDLTSGLQALESDLRLEYQLYETRDDRNFISFTSLLDAPWLGISRTGATMTDDSYIAYRRGSTPRVHAIPQRRGGVKYQQDLSAGVMMLQPGGLHATGAVVAGRVAPCGAAAASDTAFVLYDAFSRTVFSGFRRIRGYSVGPDAYRAFKEGKRLVTIGIRSPATYDLADPES